MQLKNKVKNHRLKKKLRKFIENNYAVNMDFEDDDSFFEKGIIDSTGVLELIAFLESKFKIKVEDEELIPENLDSINNLSNFIQGKYK